MDEEKKRNLALMRYAIIAPAICHTIPEDMTTKEFLEEAAKLTYTNPDGKPCSFSVPTIERWYYEYRKHGFEGLMPSSRNDCGMFRKVDDEIQATVKYYKENFPRMPATEIFAKMVDDGLIANGDLSLSTLTRCVNKIKTDNEISDKNEMRRYERPHINEVWCGDSCVGPKILIEGCKRRIYIQALIDDSSRFIVGAGVSFNDDYLSLMELIKSSVTKYGVPNMFSFDNGKNYRSTQMELLTAKMGSSVHYCHPYSPTEKAKIERWFRTLRDKWLSYTDLSELSSIDEIQKSLDLFVRRYNQSKHSSLNDCSPEERFFSESGRIRKLDPDKIDKIFMLEITRKVSSDCVITIDNVEYEVDFSHAGKRITLRYSPDMSELYAVENDDSLVPIRLLNKQENASVKRNKVYYSGGDY